MSESHCPCIAISHPHEAGHCDEPAAPNGGVCPGCRWYAKREEA